MEQGGPGTPPGSLNSCSSCGAGSLLVLELVGPVVGEEEWIIARFLCAAGWEESSSYSSWSNATRVEESSLALD